MNQAAPVQPRSILLALLSSFVVAALALVVFVLPAEYGLDPIGIGERLGIKNMSGYSVNALSAESGEFKSDYVEFPLGPFESIEYKYSLDAGQAMVYSWQAEADVVYDFHSEEVGTDPQDAISFSTGRASAQHGTYVAPYAGIHGWFWENRGQQEVTVRLKTTGYFSQSTTFSRSGEYVRQL